MNDQEKLSMCLRFIEMARALEASLAEGNPSPERKARHEHAAAVLRALQDSVRGLLGAR